MLVELSRREKAAKIIPDADIDVFMKVKERLPVAFSQVENIRLQSNKSFLFIYFFVVVSNKMYVFSFLKLVLNLEFL